MRNISKTTTNETGKCKNYRQVFSENRFTSGKYEVLILPKKNMKY